MSEVPKNILIVRTDRIGDVVLSLPLASIIKKHYPESKVFFLIRNYTKDLTYKHPYIDDTILLAEKNGKIDLKTNLKKIKEKNIDTAIIVNPTFKISLILFLAKINKRVGTGYRWYSFLFNKKLFVHRKYGEMHELEFNIGMLKTIGINDVTQKDVAFDIQISDESIQKVDDILRNVNFNPEIPTVIIHPGSGGSALDLPINKMNRLTDLLAQELSINLLVTGSKSEIEICNTISNKKSKIVNLAGYLKLRELIALINKSDMLIANSTGPIHIASALGKYVVGFYPNTPACSPIRWGPYTTKKIVFTPEVDCKNCDAKKYSEINCMESIDISNVFNEIKKIIDTLIPKGK